MSHWDSNHPFRWRTWLRSRLPWFMIDLGLASKGDDCERFGGQHWWFNRDGETSGCYHCQVVRPGRLWEMGADPLPLPAQQQVRSSE